MVSLNQGEEAGLQVVSEEEEFSFGLSECGCLQQTRLDLAHSQLPSPGRGKVNRRASLSPHQPGQFPLQFLGLNILISGITEAIVSSCEK